MLPEPKIVWSFEDWFLKEIEKDGINLLLERTGNNKQYIKGV